MLLLAAVIWLIILVHHLLLLKVVINNINWVNLDSVSYIIIHQALRQVVISQISLHPNQLNLTLTSKVWAFLLTCLRVFRNFWITLQVIQQIALLFKVVCAYFLNLAAVIQLYKTLHSKYNSIQTILTGLEYHYLLLCKVIRALIVFFKFNGWINSQLKETQ